MPFIFSFWGIEKIILDLAAHVVFNDFVVLELETGNPETYAVGKEK
jgi:hypothetical protein